MRKLNLKEILLPALSLFLICLGMTAALAILNAVTAEPIAAAEQRAVNAAKREIFPGAEFEGSAAYIDGALAGYCIETAAQGYGGEIKVMTGISPEGNILRVQFVACEGETPGLGTKVAQEGFLSQFIGQFAVNQIDSIASATYSSNGVKQAVDKALVIYREEAGQ